jgi:Fe-S-cluster containining protein
LEEDRSVPDDQPLDAGAFATWVVDMRAAIRGERGSDVPCNGCTACCTSSQFVHVEPDETRTLARIPVELRFPAPGRPRGHVVLGYDEQGRCPMLVDNRCSIYDDRPRACRAYDCRIFAAAGVAVGGDDKALVAERVARWRFSYPTAADRERQAAVRAAAVHVEARGHAGSDDAVPMSPTGIAVRAVELHEDFLP